MKGDFEKAVARPTFVLLHCILCHMYHCHFGMVEALGQIPHLNALFAHFIAFAREFVLLSAEEQSPMDQLSNALLIRGGGDDGKSPLDVK